MSLATWFVICAIGVIAGVIGSLAIEAFTTDSGEW